MKARWPAPRSSFIMEIPILVLKHPLWRFTQHNVYGSVQDCSNSSALAMELLQSCTKPLIDEGGDTLL